MMRRPIQGGRQARGKAESQPFRAKRLANYGWVLSQPSRYCVTAAGAAADAATGAAAATVSGAVAAAAATLGAVADTPAVPPSSSAAPALVAAASAAVAAHQTCRCRPAWL